MASNHFPVTKSTLENTATEDGSTSISQGDPVKPKRNPKPPKINHTQAHDDFQGFLYCVKRSQTATDPCSFELTSLG